MTAQHIPEIWDKVDPAVWRALARSWGVDPDEPTEAQREAEYVEQLERAVLKAWDDADIAQRYCAQCDEFYNHAPGCIVLALLAKYADDD